MAGLGTGTNYIPSNVSFQSVGNTTTTPLGISETFTGTAEQNQQPYVVVDCTADADGTIFFDFSVDGTNWESYPQDGFDVVSGQSLLRSAYKGPRHFRVRLVNGAAAQTSLRLYTYYDAIAILDCPLNKPIELDESALITRPTSYQDEKVLGLRAGAEVVYKFTRRTDLDTSDGDALIIADNTTNSLNIMSSADTFDISYNNATDGASTTGALSLAIQYIDANNKLATAVHVLGSTGSDTTSFTGLGINRAVVLFAGSNQVNANDITITDTSGATVQSFIAAGIGFAQEAVFHMPDNAEGIIKHLVFGALRSGGGSNPDITFSLYIFNRVRNTNLKAIPEALDTNIETTRKIFDSDGYRIRPNDVIYVTAETDTNNTDVFARFQVDVHTK